MKKHLLTIIIGLTLVVGVASAQTVSPISPWYFTTGNTVQTLLGSSTVKIRSNNLVDNSGNKYSTSTSGGSGGLATSSQGQYDSGNIFLSLNSSTAIAFNSLYYDSSTQTISTRAFDTGISVSGYSSSSANLSTAYNSVRTSIYGGDIFNVSGAGGTGSSIVTRNIEYSANVIEGAGLALNGGDVIFPDNFTGNAGSVSISAGSSVDLLENPTSTGGSIYLEPGDGSVDGNVWILDPTSGNSALIGTSLLSGDRTFSFPDATGTFCLTNTCAKAISATSTQVANAAATQTSLASSTITTSTVPNTGDSFTFRAAGTFAGTVATDKRIKVLVSNLGGATTTIFDSGNLAITSDSDWTLSGYCMVTGANTQKCATSMNTSFASLGAYADYATSTVTSTQAISLNLQGSGTNASDVVAQIWRVGLEPAP